MARGPSVRRRARYSPTQDDAGYDFCAELPSRTWGFGYGLFLTQLRNERRNDWRMWQEVATRDHNTNLQIHHRGANNPNRSFKIVPTITHPARKLAFQFPETLLTPAVRRPYFTGTSITRSPFRSARTCISTVQP